MKPKHTATTSSCSHHVTCEGRFGTHMHTLLYHTIFMVDSAPCRLTHLPSTSKHAHYNMNNENKQIVLHTHLSLSLSLSHSHIHLDTSLQHKEDLNSQHCDGGRQSTSQGHPTVVEPHSYSLWVTCLISSSSLEYLLLARVVFKFRICIVKLHKD